MISYNHVEETKIYIHTNSNLQLPVIPSSQEDIRNENGGIEKEALIC